MRPRLSKRPSGSGHEGTRPAEMHSASCDGVSGGVARYEDAVRHVVGILGRNISCDYDSTEKRGSEFIARGLISMLKVRRAREHMDDIDELIDAAQTFYADARRDENGRSRSWEHCYRTFRDARTDPSPDCDYLSLHLAFYLASWGMYRGSCFLLQKDYKVLLPIVEEILKVEYDCLFGVACASLRDSEVQGRLMKLYKYIAEYFRPIRDEVVGRAVASSVSPVLVTKILMGTLGCVPAYDRFFQDGVGTYKVTTQEYSLKSVLRLVDFYEEHNDRLEEARRGMRTDDLTYPQMKVLDMGFWQVGFEKS